MCLCPVLEKSAFDSKSWSYAHLITQPPDTASTVTLRGWPGFWASGASARKQSVSLCICICVCVGFEPFTCVGESSSATQTLLGGRLADFFCIYMLTYVYTTYVNWRRKQRMKWLPKETNTHSSIDFYSLPHFDECASVCLSVQYCSSNAVGSENLLLMLSFNIYERWNVPREIKTHFEALL